MFVSLLAHHCQNTPTTTKELFCVRFDGSLCLPFHLSPYIASSPLTLISLNGCSICLFILRKSTSRTRSKHHPNGLAKASSSASPCEGFWTESNEFNGLIGGQNSNVKYLTFHVAYLSSKFLSQSRLCAQTETVCIGNKAGQSQHESSATHN